MEEVAKLKENLNLKKNFLRNKGPNHSFQDRQRGVWGEKTKDSGWRPWRWKRPGGKMGMRLDKLGKTHRSGLRKDANDRVAKAEAFVKKSDNLFGGPKNAEEIRKKGMNFTIALVFTFIYFKYDHPMYAAYIVLGYLFKNPLVIPGIPGNVSAEKLFGLPVDVLQGVVSKLTHENERLSRTFAQAFGVISNKTTKSGENVIDKLIIIASKIIYSIPIILINVIGYMIPFVFNIVAIPVMGILSLIPFFGVVVDMVFETLELFIVDGSDLIIMRFLLTFWKLINKLGLLEGILKMCIMGYIMYNLVEHFIRVYMYFFIFCIVFVCLSLIKYIVNRILDSLFELWAKGRGYKTVKNNFRILIDAIIYLIFYGTLIKTMIDTIAQRHPQPFGTLWTIEDEYGTIVERIKTWSMLDDSNDEGKMIRVIFTAVTLFILGILGLIVSRQNLIT
tara:strand:- start:4089 stop:5429 length:1341 start_codon:yes stop_codon:yes gene_type:complete